MTMKYKHLEDLPRWVQLKLKPVSLKFPKFLRADEVYDMFVCKRCSFWWLNRTVSVDFGSAGSVEVAKWPDCPKCGYTLPARMPTAWTGFSRRGFD